jgi:hypothetical protein
LSFNLILHFGLLHNQHLLCRFFSDGLLDFTYDCLLRFKGWFWLLGLWLILLHLLGGLLHFGFFFNLLNLSLFNDFSDNWLFWLLHFGFFFNLLNLSFLNDFSDFSDNWLFWLLNCLFCNKCFLSWDYFILGILRLLVFASFVGILLIFLSHLRF